MSEDVFLFQVWMLLPDVIIYFIILIMFVNIIFVCIDVMMQTVFIN